MVGWRADPDDPGGRRHAVLNSNEVGGLYERRGQARPVSAVTGLWALLLGWFFYVGLIVWFVKTNGALNDYWRSLGAR